MLTTATFLYSLQRRLDHVTMLTLLPAGMHKPQHLMHLMPCSQVRHKGKAKYLLPEHLLHLQHAPHASWSLCHLCDPKSNP